MKLPGAEEELARLQELFGPGDADPPRAPFRALAEDKSVSKKIYILSQLGTEKLLPLAQDETIPWWLLMSAAAFAGDLGGMSRVYEGAQQAGVTVEPSNALAWVAEPLELENIRGKGNAAVIRQLIVWKGDPNADDGKWLEKSLKTLDTASIRVLVENGAAPATVFRVMGELVNAKNFEQAARVQEALTKGELFIRIDDDTVMQTKFIPGPDGGAQLKAVFNFKSRRVNEIYESAGPQGRTAMTSVLLDDYDAAAADHARLQLQKLGGRPPEDTLGKPRRPALPAP